MEKLYMVYSPVSGKEEAEKIAEIIISEHLAACANIADKVSSIYQWDGKVQRDTEALLILKTKESLLEKLENKIKELHSYECPCIASLPVYRVNEEYAKWVEKETGQG